MLQSSTDQTITTGRRRPYRRIAAFTATMLAAATLGVVPPANAAPPIITDEAVPPQPVPSTGEAWPGVENQVDALFKAYVEEFNLPGASLAASKDGRLVISKGYGYANTTEGELLDSDDQILLGSVTKALITGPSVVKVMAEAGLPLDTPLYGAGGAYGTQFDQDIAIGAAASETPLEWYYAITVQNVLDHNAGFGGADTEGTMDLFDLEEDEVTYELIHRHFLQTAGLNYEPGTAPNDVNYSNHHFGSMKVLIEHLSGQLANDYVANSYLAPWGLDQEIEPRSNPYGPSTADNHKYVDDEPVPYTPDYSGDIGSLAGGFRSSSRDAVELMTRLSETYSPTELDHMGFWRHSVNADMEWGDDTSAYLDHNGVISGARDWVFMTVDGINVAIQIHISNGEARLAMPGLFSDIAELLRDEDIPVHYDLWTGCTLPALSPGYSQVARHGIAAADYQCTFDQISGAGYELEWLDVSTAGNAAFFNAIFVPSDGDAWRAFHGLDGSAYQELFDTMTDRGMAPAQIDSYPSKGGVRYAGFFEPATTGFVAYHGLTSAEHQTKFDELKGKGYSPTSLSVVPVNGVRRYTGVYEQGVPGSFFVRSTVAVADYQELFDSQRRDGRSPVYLNGYNDENGTARLVAIFRSKPETPFKARHGMTSGQYQTEWDQATAAGYETTVVTAYSTGKRLGYAAVWRKQ